MDTQLQEVASWLSNFVPNRSFLINAGSAEDPNDSYGHWKGVLHVRPNGQTQLLPRGAELMCAHPRGRVLLMTPIRPNLPLDSETTRAVPYAVSWYDCHSGDATELDNVVLLTSMPVWSNSGDRLAYIGWSRKSPTEAQLLCTEIASRMTVTIARDWGNAGSFRWLHDDSRVAAVKSNRDGFAIRHFDLSGHVIESKDFAVMTHYLDLSPAGTHVAFVEDPGWFDLRLHILPVTGGTDVVFSRLAVEPNLVWSNDGSRILYYAFDAADKMRLYAFDVLRRVELLSLMVETDDETGEIPRNAPCFLDDNRFVAVSEFRDESDELIVADLQSQTVETLQTGIRLDKLFVVNDSTAQM